MYRRLIGPLLYLLPPEAAHRLASFVLRLTAAIPGLKRLLRKLLLGQDSRVRVQVFGKEFPNPLGLAAGFDKDAVGFDALGALGFGFVEVGTLTAQAQAGNQKPRLFRLPADRALINRMGFNNCGAEQASGRLSKKRNTLVGVNIGRSRNASNEDAVNDYVASAKHVAPYADYIVVNVNSPNTVGVRDLQAIAALRPLLIAVREAVGDKPLLVKIAPDLANHDIDAIADLALELHLEGIVAVNTTVTREGLRTDPTVIEACGAGGLSGAPLHARSLDVLRRLHKRVGSRLVLISVGGIENAGQAWERILAGATLVQMYTAFIYEGPLFPSRLVSALGRKVRQAGLTSLEQAVGRQSVDLKV